jgi:hypothetical protein
MEIFISLTLWLIMGSLTAYFASQRGRDPIAWFVLGMFLGLLGLLILFLLPNLTDKSENSSDEGMDESQLFEADYVDVSKEYIGKEWYFLDDHREQQGPLSFESLQDEWRKNKISTDSYVWSDGMADWKRIIDLKGFIEALNAKGSKDKS